MRTTFQQDSAPFNSCLVSPALGSLHQYITERYSIIAESNIDLYKKGDWIYKSGQPSTRIYEVVAGVVRTSNLTEEGEEVTADILTHTDLFGNLGILPDPFSGNAKALTDTHLRFYDICFLSNLKTTDPIVNAWFNGYIMHRWNLLEKRLLLISTRRTVTKVDFLYELFDTRVEDAHGRHHTLLELLTQKDMADLVGATRQTVAAVLKKRGSGRQ